VIYLLFVIVVVLFIAVIASTLYACYLYDQMHNRVDRSRDTGQMHFAEIQHLKKRMNALEKDNTTLHGIVRDRAVWNMKYK